MSFLTKIFGSSNQRSLKRMQVYVNNINKLEENYQKLSDSDFLTLKNNSPNRSPSLAIRYSNVEPKFIDSPPDLTIFLYSLAKLV